MSEERIKALEERVAAMDKDMQAVSRAVATAIALLARNDPKKLRFAERLRTLGDRPEMESQAARDLLDAIADRVETPYGPRPVRLAVLFDSRKRIAYVLTGAGQYDLHKIASDKEFISTIFSFGRMDKDDYREARKPRLQIVRAEKGTTMESLAEQSPISNYALDKLRVMNGMYPNGEPEPGQLIKIVD